MKIKHPLLKRQLQKLELDDSHPPSAEKLIALFEKIDTSYTNFDQERELLERSLLISSVEMQERWLDLQNQKESVIQNSKMATLGEMAGGIAHEINNPLAIISLLAEMLITKTDATDPKLAEIATKINVTTQRIASIVKGLLNFSRNGGEDPLTPCAVLTIVNDSLSICQEKFKINKILFEVKIDPSHTLNCRSVQISQVLMNLFTNSFDAILGSESPWIRIESKINQDELVLTVSDSGKGLPESISARIMEPFFTTKVLGKGTGLGLSISKGIVENHGGRIKINKTSPNTCFVLTFPTEATLSTSKAA